MKSHWEGLSEDLVTFLIVLEMISNRQRLMKEKRFGVFWSLDDVGVTVR
jgi:hypothetical protein